MCKAVQYNIRCNNIHLVVCGSLFGLGKYILTN